MPHHVCHNKTGKVIYNAITSQNRNVLPHQVWANQDIDSWRET